MACYECGTGPTKQYTIEGGGTIEMCPDHAGDPDAVARAKEKALRWAAARASSAPATSPAAAAAAAPAPRAPAPVPLSYKVREATRELMRRGMDVAELMLDRIERLDAEGQKRAAELLKLDADAMGVLGLFSEARANFRDARMDDVLPPVA